ncbi:MAG: hypothetical protein IJ567_10635 [Lachnospiraceae bacterium]|nr:hypothetical protein [Lachnospiraceae bacterium]
MYSYEGTSVSSGMAHGKILYFCARRENFANELTTDVEKELLTLQKGIRLVNEELADTAARYREENREQEAILTEARQLLLSDIIASAECEKMISERHYSARRTVLEAETRFRLEFEDMKDDFMRERAYDIQYVMEMLLDILGGNKRKFPELTEPVILVADELIPEETLFFEKNNILGIMIYHSNYNSHGAILARLWSIPAVVGIAPSIEWNDKEAVLDAVHGTLYLEPEPEQIAMVHKFHSEASEDDSETLP